jgi:hypothetical protein
MTTEKIGSQGFKWFFGVVEDRDDPLKLGRCRVRVDMVHDVENNKIPTEDLPWAVAIMPLVSASSKEIGLAPVGPIIGSTVFGFYMDGDESQIPIIMGTLPGTPEKHDVKDLAREINTISKQLLGPEPESAFKAKYPFNKVFSSESGHIFEIDDTPNFERIHQYHKSGTYTEINAAGDHVQKIVGDGYEIIAKNNTVYVQGNVNIVVKGNANYTVEGNMNLNVGGSMNVTVGGETNLRYNSNLREYIGGDYYLRKKAGGTDFTCPADIRTGGTDCS